MLLDPIPEAIPRVAAVEVFRDVLAGLLTAQALVEALNGRTILTADDLSDQCGVVGIHTFLDGTKAAVFAARLAEDQEGGSPTIAQLTTLTQHKPTLDLQLQNKVILVTGGQGDIGKCLVRHLIEEAGARVVIADLPSTEGRAVETIKQYELRGLHSDTDPRVAFVPIDMSDKTTIKPGVEKSLNALGNIYSIVHLASSFPFNEIENYTGDDFDRMDTCMHINGTNLLRLFREVTQQCPKFIEDKGSVFGMSSVAAIQAEPKGAAYSSAKLALEGVIKQIAIEYGRLGISASALELGHTHTRPHILRIEESGMDREQFEREVSYIKQTALGRFIEPEEVARMIMFMISPHGKPCSGHMIPFAMGLGDINTDYYTRAKKD